MPPVIFITVDSQIMPPVIFITVDSQVMPPVIFITVDSQVMRLVIFITVDSQVMPPVMLAIVYSAVMPSFKSITVDSLFMPSSMSITEDSKVTPLVSYVDSQAVNKTSWLIWSQMWTCGRKILFLIRFLLLFGSSVSSGVLYVCGKVKEGLALNKSVLVLGRMCIGNV